MAFNDDFVSLAKFMKGQKPWSTFHKHAGNVYYFFLHYRKQLSCEMNWKLNIQSKISL